MCGVDHLLRRHLFSGSALKQVLHLLFSIMVEGAEHFGLSSCLLLQMLLLGYNLLLLFLIVNVLSIYGVVLNVTWIAQLPKASLRHNGLV